MLLLEIVSEHKAMMGANARRLVDEPEAAEFTIGRLETCSWVLPQDYVSRVQAVLRCVNNMYFLERKGSTLLAINDRSRPIERNRIVRLSPGDVILIDDIEIQTSEVEAGYVPPPAPLPDSPDALVAAGLYDPSAASGRAGEDIMSLITGDPERRAVPAPVRVTDVPGHSTLDHVLDFGGSGACAAPGLQPEDDRWWEDEGTSAVGAAAPPASQHPVKVPSPGRGERSEPAPLIPPAQPREPAGADVTLGEILRGAGLDPAHTVIAPEVARQLGEILRLVVDGTMEMLKARNAIRRELRVPSTQLAPKRNNPLKFSADVDDALHKLFIQRAPAYLDTVSAFGEAFEDIRRHQFALLKSVGVAFDSMLAKFDPKELEKNLRLEGGRAGVLGLGGGKTRQWEAYARLYAELIDDRDQAYRELFGDRWASAYETELRSPLPAGTTDGDSK
jgi:type VI secretion system FHA domain protein